MSFLLWCTLVAVVSGSGIEDGFPPTQVMLPSKVTEAPEDGLPQVLLPPREPAKPPVPRPRPLPIKPKPKTPVRPAKTNEPQHSHKCEKCGYVWSHGESSFGNAKAHTCPKCGSGPWWNQVPGSRRAPTANNSAPLRQQVRPQARSQAISSTMGRSRANCPT